MEVVVMKKHHINWEQEFLVHEASGLSAVKFCKNKEYTVHNFYGHRNRRRKIVDTPTFALVPTVEESEVSITIGINGISLTFDPTLSQESLNKVILSLLQCND